MFAQKLITLSAIVLIFAIMNINAQNNNGGGQNRGGRGRPPSGVLAMMSLCRQYNLKNFCSNENSILNFFS